MMRIAYLSTFYPYRGGIAQFNAALYRVMERENEVKAFTFFRQYPGVLFPGQSQFVTPEDKADPIPSEKILDTINPLGYYMAANRVKQFKPDMMITKYWMPFFAPSLGTVAKNIKKNTVNIAILDNVIPHEKRPGDIKLTNFFLNQYHGFVVMSDTVKNDLLSLKPDAKFIENVHPLYNHFGEKLNRSEARDRLQIPFDKKVLLFFGFIRNYKGLDILLEAIKDLPEDYHLVIAGEVYGSFGMYQDLIDKYNLEDKITKHVRYISDDEVPQFFSACDVCVLPYRSATQSGIVGISYQFDMPLIATNVGSLGEMIEPYGTGIMVDEANPDKIKNAILEYFGKSSIEIFSHNILKYKKIASWETLAYSIYNLYDSIKSE